MGHQFAYTCVHKVILLPFFFFLYHGASWLAGPLFLALGALHVLHELQNGSVGLLAGPHARARGGAESRVLSVFLGKKI
jgi:hypothetical protein